MRRSLPYLGGILLLAGLILPLAVTADEAELPDSWREASVLFFAQHDTDKDGKLSEQEYPAWLRAWFRKIDKDRDGFVTPEEDLSARAAFATAIRRGGSGRKIPEGVKVLRDVEYAKVDGKSLRLDLYLPKDTSAKPPLFVWIHGGGWTRGSKSGVNPMVVRLAGEGYAAASIDYRLEGLSSHPKQIHDCKGAIRWLRANAGTYGYDPARVGVGGGSAGGHLSLLLGMSGGVEGLEGTIGGNADASSRVLAVIDMFGPSELTSFESLARRHRLAETDAFLHAASPLSYLTPDDPPVLILHGSKDRLVPLSQSEVVHERYEEAGLPCTLHVIEGAGHGGPQFSDETRWKLVKAFLDRHVKGRRVTTPTETSDTE